MKGRFIIEHIVQGLYLKVTVIDSITGEEASSIGPADKASAQILEKQAMQKLLKKLGN